MDLQPAPIAKRPGRRSTHPSPWLRSSLTLVPTADSESALWPKCSPHLTIVHSQPCLPWDSVMPVWTPDIRLIGLSPDCESWSSPVASSTTPVVRSQTRFCLSRSWSRDLGGSSRSHVHLCPWEQACLPRTHGPSSGYRSMLQPHSADPRGHLSRRKPLPANISL